MLNIKNLLSTIRLFIPFSFLGVGIFLSVQSFFTAFVVPLIFFATDSSQELFRFSILFFATFLVIGIFTLIISLLLYLVALTIYYRLLILFWSSPPKIFCIPKGLKDRIYHFSIACIASIPIVLIFNVYLFLASGFSLRRYVRNLTYEPLYKLYNHNPGYYFDNDLISGSHRISMVELLVGRSWGYGLMLFFICSYLIYWLIDKFLKNQKSNKNKLGGSSPP